MSPNGEGKRGIKTTLSHVETSAFVTLKRNIKDSDVGFIRYVRNLRFTKKTSQEQLISVNMVCHRSAMQPMNSNVTPIKAPYRVRVIEIVIEVMFEESMDFLYSTFSLLHPQSLNFTQSQKVSVNRCLHLNIFNVHETLFQEKC